MPAEPMTLMLRPRNFFLKNPALDVPPSYSSTPSQVKAGGKGIIDVANKMSMLAFGQGPVEKNDVSIAESPRDVGYGEGVVKVEGEGECCKK